MMMSFSVVFLLVSQGDLHFNILYLLGYDIVIWNRKLLIFPLTNYFHVDHKVLRFSLPRSLNQKMKFIPHMVYFFSDWLYREPKSPYRVTGTESSG